MGCHKHGEVSEVDDIVNPDVVAPSLISTTVTPTSGSAQFSWVVSEPCTIHIDYGSSTVYSNNIKNDTVASSGSSTLTGLQENATYYYRMTPVDVAGNTGNYNTDSFVTQLASGHTLTIQPATVTLHFGESQTFTGTLTDSQGYTHNSDICWYLFDYLSMGTLSDLPNGEVTFTAGTSEGIVELTAYYSSDHIYPAVLANNLAPHVGSAIATITIFP